MIRCRAVRSSATSEVCGSRPSVESRLHVIPRRVYKYYMFPSPVVQGESATRRPMNWKPLLGIGVLMAAVAVGVGFFYPFQERRDRLWLPGVVEIQEIRLGSKVGGRVAEVKAVEGELVE